MSADKLYIDWSEFDSTVYAIAQAVQSEIDTECVVGIGRGGLPGSVMLSHALDADHRTVSADYYDGEDRNDQVVLRDTCSTPDGSTLIFDDIVDTGATMQEVEALLSEPAGNKVVKTASVHVKPDREMTPDFWIEEVDRWVVYPWEVDL